MNQHIKRSSYMARSIGRHVVDLNWIQTQLREAAQFTSLGGYRDSADGYERAAAALRSPDSRVQSSVKSQLLRSVCFNLAQVLNKCGEFDRALGNAEEGLRLSPTGFGRAIGLSAQGEALYGLGQRERALATFRQAVVAHPIVGRLNSADSMVRLGRGELLAVAEQWVEEVAKAFERELTAEWLSEVHTIRGRIAVRRGDYATARALFETALRIYPECADAKLQLRWLPPAKSF
jgi:tetratricopeptide (TPR) repeat protein